MRGNVIEEANSLFYRYSYHVGTWELSRNVLPLKFFNGTIAQGSKLEVRQRSVAKTI